MAAIFTSTIVEKNGIVNRYSGDLHQGLLRMVTSLLRVLSSFVDLILNQETLEPLRYFRLFSS
ncbi:hypothetical protein BN873_190061 [Candidatus Competibacter denitrificans Run_A_D11]|uniref:Uncharacterized protein n=1 Tax=Candidatus Competibacter denitrificans Run_A_D11 TaxID=1400863 RepID=W6M2F2_9GAMM|nr:hypothetical protein BN873_190061 [Candidatus Competibacter denitrificans Run_A_D11]